MGDFGAAVSQKGYDVKTCADRFLVYSSAFQTLKVFNTYSVSTTIPATTSTASFTVDASTNVFTSVGHGLSNGQVLNFTSSDTLPSPLLEYPDAYYYVISATTDTFKVSLTAGGTEIDITDAGVGTHDWYQDTNGIQIDHNLGYLAPFFIVYTGSTTAGRTKSYFFTVENDTIPCFQYNNSMHIFVDDLFDSSNSSAGDTVYFTVYQFLDDFSTISAQNINTELTSGSSSTDYGLRISKAGYDVKTCADIDCVLSSSFFNQIVHMKGIALSSTVAHNLGYIPNFIAYEHIATISGLRYNASFISADTTNINFAWGGNNYYIIFKDKING